MLACRPRGLPRSDRVGPSVAWACGQSGLAHKLFDREPWAGGGRRRPGEHALDRHLSRDVALVTMASRAGGRWCRLLSQEAPFFLSYPRTDAKSGGRAGSRSSDQLVRGFFVELCGEFAPLVHL